MNWLFIALGLSAALGGVVYLGRLLIVAVYVRAHFPNEASMWRYVVSAGVLLPLGAWLLLSNIPAVLP